jgi:2,3-bisphosphoglycerate-independent phosphoglycerate mutase
MGYNPQGVLSGRGPLEAASLGLDAADDELVFRMNLVTLSHEGGGRFMRDHAAGNITNGEAAELLESLAGELPLTGGQRIFPGVSYRHILTWPEMPADALPSFPPHDYRDQEISRFLDDPAASPIMDLTRASWPILEGHPVNKKRAGRGLAPANSIWLWGQGLTPRVKSYQERWGISGAAISAVDLIRGLGIVTGLAPVKVQGATGWLDTNYQGKVEAALAALERYDYAVLHVEAPDEASHQGDLDLKMRAIHDFDARVVGPLLGALPKLGEEVRILAACDHCTPVSIKTHTADPVPFILYGSGRGGDFPLSGLGYSEANAAKTGILLDPGAELGHLFFGEERK